MQSVNPDHPFIIQMKRGPAFGIEQYSEKTLQQAIKLANGQHLEDPDWVQIVDREDKIIITCEQTSQNFEEFCNNNGISRYLVEVSCT